MTFFCFNSFQTPSGKYSTSALICQGTCVKTSNYLYLSLPTIDLDFWNILMSPTHIYITLDREEIKKISWPVPGYHTCALQDMRHKVKL